MSTPRSALQSPADSHDHVPAGYLAAEFALNSVQWQYGLAQYHRHACPYFVGVIKEIHKKWLIVAVTLPLYRTHQQASPDVGVKGFISGRYLQQKRTANHFVAIGDEVICQYGRLHQAEDLAPLNFDQGPYAVIHRKPRANTLYRQDPFYKDRQHILGVNIDQMVVVASFVHPDICWQLMDHYLVYAEIYELDVLIVITKKDLITAIGEGESGVDLGMIMDRLQLYKSLGYKLYLISLCPDKAVADMKILSEDMAQYPLFQDHQGDHLRLAAQMRHRTSVLSGLSGVGKSSLVNDLGGEDYRKVGVSYRYGKHTTSSSRLVKLSEGGYVMDTPGLKSFPLHYKHKSRLSGGYREFQPYERQCRFATCMHLNEPDCAIKQACARGDIAEWRYDSYQRLMSSCDLSYY